LLIQNSIPPHALFISDSYGGNPQEYARDGKEGKMKKFDECANLIDCACYWEETAPHRDYLTQPLGGDKENVRIWTWEEALKESRSMAAYLKRLDLPAKSHIAICSKNCAYWIMADLAIWMSGHVSIPVFPNLTTAIFNYTLEHSDARLLFVGKLDKNWEEMKTGVPAGMPMIDFPMAPESNNEKWDDIVGGNKPLADLPKRDRGEVATIIYTSGSTGKPKGVMISFGAMYDSVKTVADTLESNPEDRMLSYLPLSHAFDRWWSEAHSFYAGFPIFFPDTMDTFLQDMKRARPTLFISVPRLWLKFQLGVFDKIPPKKLERLLKIPVLKGIIKKKVLSQLGLDHVRIAGCGSAPISKEIIEWYRNLGLELLEGCGMTENFVLSHLTRKGEVRPGYVGPPWPGVEHKISPEGEVLIKSRGNMIGYYKDPEATKAAFTEDGYLKTGDKGEIDEMNRLKLTGRVKEIFKTAKGKYISPAPIENLVASHPRVEACLVSGTGFPQPFAVVMLSEQARNDLENGGAQTIARELEDHLKTVNRQLAAYERMTFLAVSRVEWLPENGYLTPTMKLKRATLENKYNAMAEQWFREKQPIIWVDEE
jgi:long-subunit acyl-CoA synthetase (AMP-forming)